MRTLHRVGIRMQPGVMTPVLLLLSRLLQWLKILTRDGMGTIMEGTSRRMVGNSSSSSKHNLR